MRKCEMESPKKTIPIKHPRVLKQLVAICIIFGVLVSDLRSHNVLLFYFSIVWGLLVLMVIIFLITRMIAIKSITIGNDYIISTNMKKYESVKIKSVVIDNERIGIIVTGKRLVPLDLYFTFKENAAINGMEEIKEWAKRNNKPIKYKFFFGWI
jgi:hypothetical protein